MRVPVPPYTQQSVQQRFPGLSTLQIRLLAIQARRPCDAPGPGAQASRYRWHRRWRQVGLVGLLPATRLQPVQAALPVHTVRQWLRCIGRITPFALGQHPATATFLPHIVDPAHRGQLLTALLDQALQEIDGPIHELPTLLHQHYVGGKSVPDLAASCGYAPRTLYGWFRRAVMQIAHTLPTYGEMSLPKAPWATIATRPDLADRTATLKTLATLLDQHHAAALVGVTGIGKTTIGAQITKHWARAGWVVLWTRVDMQQIDPVQAVLADLHRQLAMVGAVSQPELATHQALDTQVMEVQRALSVYPTLVIMDDVHDLTTAHSRQVIATLLAAQSTLRVLLVGQTYPIALGPVVTVDALSESVLRHWFMKRFGAVTEEHWHHLITLTEGNFALLQLMGGATDKPLSPMRMIMDLDALAQRALAWVAWCPSSIAQMDPLLDAAGVPRATWQRLARWDLIQIQGTHYVLHAVVRRQAERILPFQVWEQARREVERAAIALERWSVAYHCAVAGSAQDSQYGICHAAAQEAERLGLVAQGVAWWERAATTAPTLSLKWRACLAAANLQVRIGNAQAALDLLSVPTTSPPTPALAWYAALYQVQAQLFLGDLDRVAQSLRQGILSGEPPTGVREEDQWLPFFERAKHAWRQGDLVAVWTYYRQVRLPACNPVDAQRFYRLGMELAHERGQFSEAARLLDLCRSLHDVLGPALVARWYYRRALVAVSQEAYRQAKRWLLSAQHIGPLRAHDPVLADSCALLQSEMAHALGRLDQGGVEGEHAYHSVRRFHVKLACGEVGHEMNALLSDGYAALRTLGDDGLRVAVQIWEAELAIRRGLDARPALQGALTLLKHYHTHRWWCFLHRTWGDWHQQQSQWEGAKRRYHTAVRTAQRQGLSVAVAEAEACMGEVLVREGQGQQALTHTTRAINALVLYPRGLLRTPRIWLAHARALEATGGDARAAWQMALDHVVFQAQHLPSDAKAEWFLTQPYYTDITAYWGGVLAMNARIQPIRPGRRSLVKSR